MNSGLIQTLWRGDAISHAIATALVAMSVLSWAVMLYKGLQFAGHRKLTAVVERQFWQEETLEHGSAKLGGARAGNIYQNLVDAALQAKDRHSGTNLEEVLSHDEWVQRCLAVSMEEQTSKLSSGLGILASIGSTAPFVGLFGTVWGIYHALMAISASGQSSLSQVAGPVGESLVMTALGLFVAIPAVLGYNALTRGNRGLISKLARFRHELHAYLMSGSRQTRPAHDKVRAPAQRRLATEGS
ncbi:MotA/TolQ/ExbB proton channel family protein [Pararobbsia silviterrae]|uniref:Biopolymer transport protein ExbB n=1 Tax=Pararobbsia silviterrae TaxID=1792498 RepID=A0A494Y4G6_9BURK|nr:MotA/TolQ/ExbB proton channel family protein [Pararobbsia silviterrae]RKP57616.1 MotA/TolQ/ExbB proton channel family protein [Pararobbsia silviterrae]